ncbi:hypothetical protein [Streptacidiphilus sp. MAP5-3]|uniref:hypothetical protein n=1 Tax=unclassified Streptacidiphilus TaxID=2643834 RepID=UPI0035153BE9
MSLPKTGLGLCGPCGEIVRWSVTAKGKRQALNAEPDPDGNVAALCDGLGVWRSRVPTVELPQAAHERLFMPHAATCTAAKRDRTPRQLPAGVISLAARRRTRRTR